MKFYLTFFYFVFFTFANAQEKKDTILIDRDINEINISVVKTVKPIKDLPIPVLIISDNEIQQFGASTLEDVINKQTGIVGTTTKTGSKGLQMQGLDASYTSILIDGFPLIGRSFGTLNLDRISVSDIESIEIIKGSSSSLYGSNALAGVVNIISKKQVKNGGNLDVNFKKSSNNTLNPYLSYKFKKSSFQITTIADLYKTEGYDLITDDLLNTVNPYINYTFRNNIRYTVTDKLLIKSHTRYFHQKQINTALYNNSVLQGESLINEHSAAISFKYIPNSNFFQNLDLYTTRYRTDEFLNDNDDILFDKNFFDHNLIQAELRSFIKFKGLNNTIGMGSIQEKLSRRDFSSNAQQNNLFIYGQIESTSFEKFQIILGSRYDNYTDYSPVLSNKLALGFSLLDNLQILASIGSGFKTPDFRQRFFDFTNTTLGYSVLGREVAFDRLTSMQNNGIIQNIIIPISELESKLNPETSLNINFGFKYTLSQKILFNFNLFKNEIDNLIETQLVATKTNQLPVFSYFNVNEVETIGFECNFSFIPYKKWKWDIGYQLLSAYNSELLNKFDTETFYARDLETNESIKLSKNDYLGLYNRSKHQINLNLYYDLNTKTRISTSVNYRSKYGLSDSNGNDFLDSYDELIDGYSLLDLYLDHQLKKNFKIYLGLKNVFGYTNPEYISSISGRNYFIKLSMNLKHN